jgi:hypothetical protein
MKLSHPLAVMGSKKSKPYILEFIKQIDFTWYANRAVCDETQVPLVLNLKSDSR